ncbi:MarR family transcriptional regulator [Microlunatus spumicola]|uniref:MarR family transcriptional regulator n=1 Tax=Microlunatus spumicola TaxID=81499 RepID=A0ABP6XRT4_9ACTN
MRVEQDRFTLEQQVCFTLSVASREVVSLYRPLLEPLGLTHPQYLVMVTLWNTEGPVSIKRLSRMLQLEGPTLSPLLKRLESAGLVLRRRDPADERSVLVTLTEQGVALEARAAGVPTTILSRLGMSLDRIATLQELLSEVIVRAKEHNDPPSSSAAVG